ncbi:MAG: extracellular solute-binding protein [Treponema sp.]|nr:extracellular solute-binding protein [Treponema sp.]
MKVKSLLINNQNLRFSILIIFFGLFFFSACHGKKALPEFKIPERFDNEKKLELSFWAKNDTNKIQSEVYEKAIADFEKFYPNVKINLKIYTDYNRIYNDIITNISTHTTPNICITYPDHIATYNTGQNVVIPLDELMLDTKFGFGGSEIKYDSIKKEEIVPEFLEECRLGEHCFALPFMRSTEALYINKDMVEKLGFSIPEIPTWEFVWEVSEAAMKKNEDGNYEVNDQNILIPFIYKSTDNMMIQYLKQKDAGYSNAEGDILIFNEETKSFLKTIAKHSQSRCFSTFGISSYPGNFFNAGQCIFAVDSTAGATWIGSHSPLSDISEDKIVSFETVVRSVPQVNTKDIKMISQGPSVCIFNKSDADEVLASWLFMQFLLSNETQIPYAQTEGYLPVTLRAQNSKEYKDYLLRGGEDNDFYYYVKIEASKLLLNNLENTFVTPVFNGSASLRNASGQMIENTVKAVRRNQTVDDEFISKNFSDVTSLFRLNETSGITGNVKDENMGPLPQTAKNLLGLLYLAWVCLIVYFISSKKKNKKK